ncbi:streptomycin biosynthesis protein StrI [Lactarius quietus]|nr:streptomycin biosynthesis protein StrI [Lactarius quietus]
MEKPITLAVVGCGQRGTSYAWFSYKEPAKCRVVAIAEPRSNTRTRFATSAETIQTLGKRLADAVVIAVQDHMHAELVVAFAAQGYDILCEKPMATSIDHCLQIEAAVKKAGVIFGMGHVQCAITEVVRSGQLGQLINAQHIEPVGHWHFAHSYVRGNWSKEAESSFSLMTKSCHDIDILCHWLSPDTPSMCHRSSSKPAEAGNATRCLDCTYEAQCPYSAKKTYLDRVASGHVGWPVSPLVDMIPDIENITDAIQNGPYGKCVYECDNDVCDHQVVNIQYASGATVSFTMVAYTKMVCERQTRLHFTHGEIIGDMNTFTVTDFRTSRTTVHRPPREGGGHGGGDFGLMRTFVEAVRTRQQELLGTDVTDVLKSHLTVFAAEHSRKTRSVVDCVEFENAARRAHDGSVKATQ